MSNHTAKELFPNWYALIIKRDASPEEIASRRKAIEEIVSKEENDFWFNVLKIALQIQVSEQFTSDFNKFFKDEDESFQITDNQNLISNLACCCIAQRIEKEDYLGDVLSISIQSFLFSHPNTSFQIVEFASFAKNAWIKECGRVRKVESTTLSSSTMTFTKGEIKNAVNSQEAFDEIKSHFVKLQKDIAALNGQVGNLIGLNEAVVVLSEETDMLWWVFGSRSRDTNENFVNVAFPVNVVRIAKESAELTKLLPGFANIASILGKTIDSNLKQESLKQNATFAEYVNSVADQLEADLLNHYVNDLDFVTPFLTSLKTRSELGSEGGTWTKVMSGKYRINSSQTTSPFELAKQLYLELMLSKAYNKL